MLRSAHPLEAPLLLLLLACAGAPCEKGDGYADLDGDGFGAGDPLPMCELAPGLVPVAGDCDDADASVSPAGAEHCDGRDEDCDGEPDDAAVDALPWYTDADLDGYGDPTSEVYACEAPAGTIATAGDCTDTDAAISPDGVEACNGADDDCDGVTDEDDAVDAQTWYADADGDGWYDEATTVTACAPPPGYGQGDWDCDDADPATHPRADEVCGGGDEDCDGLTDEGSAIDAPTWYRDDDGDGYGYVTERACEQPEGFVDIGGDCDDSESAIHPGATDEPGDRVDANCDGKLTCWADADLDRYGGAAEVESADSDCSDAGERSTSTDCDDTDASVHPGAEEIPYDAVDQDCDGADIIDADGDGWSAAEVGGPDCDDSDPTVSPVATEVCDYGLTDEDCDGLVDDADPDLADTIPRYADRDGDGWGDPASSVTLACEDAAYVTNAGDCDDGDAAVNPLAVEACDATVDLNCDGEVGTGDADGDGAIACQDCDDRDGAQHPGATDGPNGEDDDCDGLVDEYVGDLSIRSEAGATVFCATYASVEGSLDVMALADLADLSCLRQVSRHLRVSNLDAPDLHGLDNLTWVGGDLLLGGWQEDAGELYLGTVLSLGGLGRLTTIGGDLWVAHGDVASLDGLARLTSVGGSATLWDLPLADATLPFTTLGGDLWIESLPDVATVAVPALTAFGGSVWLTYVGRASGAFTLTWDLPIPGALGLREIPAGANADWRLPDHVGALYVEDTDLTDLAGLELLTEVDGDVAIEDNPSLADLSALDGVTTIGGDATFSNNRVAPDLPAVETIGGRLWIEGTTQAELGGYGALTSIGDGLVLYNNDALQHVSGFGALTECPDLVLTSSRTLLDADGLAGVPFSRDVEVWGNSVLADLSFLSGVTALTGALHLETLSAVTSLDGLDGLTRVDGAVELLSLYALTDPSALASLTSIGGALTVDDLRVAPTLGMTSLRAVGGDVAITDMDALVDLTGLSALEQVGGLFVSDADLLVDLTGLGALTTVDGSVILERNDALGTLAGADALTTIGVDLRVSANNALGTFSGLDALTSVGQDVTIRSNPLLQRPDGLGALTWIGRDLWVDANRSLLDLHGLGLVAVGNTVWLFENASLETVDGLDALTDVPHHLVFAGSPRLRSLAALTSLTHVGGDLRVGDCDSLPDLTGLDALIEVGGSLEIGYQVSWPGWGGGEDSLVSLAGLGALTTVGDDLAIAENPLLADISALAALESVGGDLYVVNNPSLWTADAQTLADGTPTVGGTLYITGNR